MNCAKALLFLALFVACAFAEEAVREKKDLLIRGYPYTGYPFGYYGNSLLRSFPYGHHYPYAYGAFPYNYHFGYNYGYHY